MTRTAELPALVEATFNLSPQDLATVHDMRGAMPLDEFLSYCVEFGIADVHDQFQTQLRDYLAQTMHSSMAQHQRSRTQREASNVKEMARLVQFRAFPGSQWHHIGGHIV